LRQMQRRTLGSLENIDSRLDITNLIDIS
jgi:hypothetical protein